MGSPRKGPRGPVEWHCSIRIVLGTAVAILASISGGCTSTRPLALPSLPRIAPDLIASPTDAVALDKSQIKAMYSELLPIDLPAVASLSAANNLEIQQARQRVEAAGGKVESSIGNAFPVFSPTALFEQVHGDVRAIQGNLVNVGFHSFQPYMLAQWVLNPGKVINDILASRRRLLASKYQERAVIQQTLRAAVLQYYDLALAQARVGSAQQALTEAQELLRLAQSRLKAGTGLPADEMRAKADWAGRQQDLILSLKAFYDASVTLSLTLHMESTVTLVPSAEKLPQTTLVKSELPVDDLLALALEHRDDLKSVRVLVTAAAAERKATWWGGLGPQAQVGYQAGGITGSAEDVNGRETQHFDLRDQERFSASASWKLGLSTFGEIKSSKAVEKLAYLDAERKLDSVKAEVVRAMQDGKAQSEVIGHARQQVQSAEEALRLTTSNIQAGTMTLLDVLHSQSTLAAARLRYSEAVVRYNQAQVSLLAAMGILEDGTLHPSPAN